MTSEESKGLLKDMDWKTASNAASDSSGPVTKKRLPKKIRQVPDYYFLPRRSLPATVAFYGAFCAAGVGAGMLLERIVESFGNLTDTESHSYGCSNSAHLESSEFLVA
ncbi:hypothetical protein ZIOFF_038413 [Zingiber officinale]|uniref:Uncharacterized protein n=1 Tax=Zingiber officinale TaxID=94328 RepID=A0A8J5G329_ZINOF|nr:hypothetical protein ZIOFF_038413 [Zingiber officinale]